MKRILVALDHSPRAAQVLAAAVQLAERCGSRLVLFRAIGVPRELPAEVLAIPATDVEDVLRRAAHADLDALAATAPPGMVERITTDLGTPWDAIVRAGREADADLIVLGSHGFHGLDRLLGTTAGRVANHADRNVMIVRTPL